MAHYIARRHVDFFRPGDEIPEGHYPPETLARMVEKGQVVAVDVAAVNEAEYESGRRVVEKRPSPRSRKGTAENR